MDRVSSRPLREGRPHHPPTLVFLLRTFDADDNCLGRRAVYAAHRRLIVRRVPIIVAQNVIVDHEVN